MRPHWKKNWAEKFVYPDDRKKMKEGRSSESTSVSREKRGNHISAAISETSGRNTAKNDTRRRKTERRRINYLKHFRRGSDNTRTRSLPRNTGPRIPWRHNRKNSSTLRKNKPRSWNGSKKEQTTIRQSEIGRTRLHARLRNAHQRDSSRPRSNRTELLPRGQQHKHDPQRIQNGGKETNPSLGCHHDGRRLNHHTEVIKICRTKRPTLWTPWHQQNV